MQDVVVNFGDRAEVILGENILENSMPTASIEFFDEKLLIVSENESDP